MTVHIGDGEPASSARFSGGEPLHGDVLESIVWHDVDDRMPDSDYTVMAAIDPKRAEPWDYDLTFEAYYDGEAWIEAATGATVIDGAVTHWAHKPVGPNK